MAFDFHALTDGQQIEVGNVQVEVLHTPGHTVDSMCLLAKDTRRGETPWFVLTGDTLFVGAVGRPDLTGRQTEMAATLWHSLQHKLLTLPNELEIYPGHQAGSVCGVGLSGKPSSTLGFERRFNRLLGLDQTTFVRELSAEVAPRPADMDAIVAANTAA